MSKRTNHNVSSRRVHVIIQGSYKQPIGEYTTCFGRRLKHNQNESGEILGQPDPPFPCSVYLWKESSQSTSGKSQARAFRNFLPLFDRILVERNLPELKTKGGIMIPEKAQGKVQEAVVVAVGKGVENEKGQVTPVSVQVGDKVLLPEYGGTKLVIEEKEYVLFRDGDLLGKFEAQ